MLQQVNNPLPLETREYVSILLNQGLVDLIDTTLQVHQCHWMIKSPAGNSTHKLFDEVYGFLLEAQDTTAERIRQLGGVPLGGVEEVVNKSQMPKLNLEVTDQSALVQTTINLLVQFVKGLHEGVEATGRYKDWATQNILIDTTQALEKFIFLLESNL